MTERERNVGAVVVLMEESRGKREHSAVRVKS